MRSLVSVILVVALVVFFVIPPDVAAAAVDQPGGNANSIFVPLDGWNLAPLAPTQSDQSLNESLHELQTQLAVQTRIVQRNPLPRQLARVPIEERWNPTEAEIQEVIEYAAWMGARVSRDDVLRASVYLKATDTLEVKAVASIAVLIVVSYIVFEVGKALVTQYAVCDTSGSSEDCSCGAFVWSALWGGLMGGLHAALFLSGASLPVVMEEILGVGVSPVSVADGAGVLAGQLFGNAVGDYLCGLVGLGQADKDQVVQSAKDEIWGQYGDGFVAAATAGGGSADPAGPVVLEISDGNGTIKPHYYSSDSVTLEVEFVPHEAGSFHVQTHARNENTNFLLDDFNVTVDVGEVAYSGEKWPAFRGKVASIPREGDRHFEGK